MTLNILFFTITIKKRLISMEEAIQNAKVEKQLEEMKNRQTEYMRPF